MIFFRNGYLLWISIIVILVAGLSACSVVYLDWKIHASRIETLW